MTRIRSPREIRITPPAMPATGAAPHGAYASAQAAKPWTAQHFGALYDTARERNGGGTGDESSGQDPSEDTGDGKKGPARDGPSVDEIRSSTTLPDAAAGGMPPTPLPDVPPLLPLHPLSGVLAALGKNPRSLADDSGSVGRKPTSASACHKSPNDARDASQDEKLRVHAMRRCAQAAEGDLLAQHLAENVARFCTSPAITRAGQWEIAVELDPAILPRTELHLSLSGAALTLRFDSRDPRGRQLICDNSNELKIRLEAHLGGRIAVDVTVL